MVFSSLSFLLIFLPVCLAAYLLVPGRYKNLFLLAASLVFYAWGEPRYVFLMIFSIAINYFSGILIEREKRGKLVLIICIALNLGLLCFFKYTDFAIENINRIGNTGISLLKLALPIGISFYTFQGLSYAVDVYRRDVRAQRNIIDFGMYISLFPQLIAGPIVRYRDIEPQIKSRSFDYSEACEGIFRFVLGLSKKVILANNLGAVWDELSALPTASLLLRFIGALAFMLQIYFDFSGYSDMAIGLGRILGFRFPENFNYPYESRSVTEFWRRWHMTLSSWFRDYLYIPLGGNRRGSARQILNLFIVWALTGLWHGAGWNFVLWGLYFFVFLAMEKLFLGRLLEKAPGAVTHIYTLLVILFSWVIFACDKTGMLGAYLRFDGVFSGTDLYYLASNAVLLAVSMLCSTSLVKRLAYKAGAERIKPVLCAALLIICVALIATGGYDPFLYFRF